MVGQSFPQFTIDESADTARSFWCTAMILTALK